jgi:Mn-dependent DtxR family transcriptional regulator
MLTMQQSNALRAIKALTEQCRGVAPSYRSLAAYMDLASSQSSFSLVSQLQRRGMVNKSSGARTIEITDKGNEFLERWP